MRLYIYKTIYLFVSPFYLGPCRWPLASPAASSKWPAHILQLCARWLGINIDFFQQFDFLITECLVEGTCVTGECQISFEPPGFECMCHSGNYGRRCELYNPCVLSPCQNGATCRNHSNSTYDCLCPEGYDGGDCTVQVGPACLHQEPCLNKGTCST